jgi:hypothetical protein
LVRCQAASFKRVLRDLFDAVPNTHEEIKDKLMLIFDRFRDEFLFAEIKLKSLILAQIERWRHALHMQVER